jgi:hypothetical protein
MYITYQAYINSTTWATKRKQRLELDGNRCRLCDEDGKRYRLEVHHRPSSYARIPDEDVTTDLITICARCHDLITSAIRSDRYGQRTLAEPETTLTVPDRRGNYGLANFEVPIDLGSPVADAFRASRRPHQRVGESHEASLWQASKNGR